MTERKALWIFPNFLETINELPEKQRADVWKAICEYGLGCEIDIKNLKTQQRMAVKMLIPLLKLRNTGGSIKRGDVKNPNGKNQFSPVSHCNLKKSEDNPYPNPYPNRLENPLDNPLYNKNRNKNKENNIKEKTLNSEFEEFWKVYPKQRIGNKNKAYSSYCRAIKEKRVSVEDLMKSVKSYANSKEVKNGYAKGCAAWLNDDRFNYTYEEVEKPIKDWSDEDWQNAILAGRR